MLSFILLLLGFYFAQRLRINGGGQKRVDCLIRYLPIVIYAKPYAKILILIQAKSIKNFTNQQTR